MSFMKGIFNKDKAPRVDLKKRFDLIARVGQGSMSKVWRATDRESGKIIALKVLDPVKTANFEARFKGLNKPTEGEIAYRLRHPNIARTFEFGISTENYQFLVMEYIHGSSLSYLVDMMKSEFCERRLDYIIQLGEAVSYLHKHKWIHRDICPRNVIVDDDKRVKLIDFGLVVPNTLDFQKPGNRTGTASYMAPELIKRQRTDERIDIFSFSVTCYEMYTKTFPWPSGNLTMEMILQHINNPPKDIREHFPGIDNQIAETIMQGLESRVDYRWQSMDKMLGSLKQVRNRLLGIEDSIPPAAKRSTALQAVIDLEEPEEEVTLQEEPKDDFMSILDSAPDFIPEPAKASSSSESEDDDFLSLDDNTKGESRTQEKTAPQPEEPQPVMSEEEEDVFQYLMDEDDSVSFDTPPTVKESSGSGVDDFEDDDDDEYYNVDDAAAFDDEDDDDYYEV